MAVNSPSTKPIHFCNKHNFHADPQLRLYNHPIPVTSEFKFFSTFHSKFSFLPHINCLKTKTIRSIYSLKIRDILVGKLS